jgi:ubiquinone/menaquinone biosynthesis C-methylase UbiE
MSRRFVPAAGHDLFLPLYDPLWRLMGGHGIREAFIRDAGLAPGQDILDIGCGTGSLAVQIAESVPGTRVIALDPDPKALARGAAKAGGAGVDVQWNEGFADALPYPELAFDRVLSSFMFHHLDLGVKQGTLREVRRVLKPDGELHLIDFGGEEHRKDGVLARLLHRHLHESHGGRITELMVEAGFGDVREVAQRTSIFGRFTHYRGAR